MKNVLIVIVVLLLVPITATWAQEVEKVSSYSLLLGAKGNGDGVNAATGVSKKLSNMLSLSAYADVGSQNTISPEIVFTPFSFKNKLTLGVFVGPNFVFDGEKNSQETDLYILGAGGIVLTWEISEGIELVGLYKKQDPMPLGIGEENLMQEKSMFGVALKLPFSKE